jgi:arylsulfatase A
LKGGKGTTTHLGTHVPLVVSWPGVSKGGRVLDDLISSVDLLPTICEAAQVKLAHTVDGVSFLPQLLGNRGTPRDSLYVWYSPRQNNKDLTVKEYAFNRNYKLYRTGEFYDLVQDSAENHPLEIDALTANQTTVRQALQNTLEQFTAARPLELDRQFRESKKADNN